MPSGVVIIDSKHKLATGDFEGLWGSYPDQAKVAATARLPLNDEMAFCAPIAIQGAFTQEDLDKYGLSEGDLVEFDTRQTSIRGPGGTSVTIPMVKAVYSVNGRALSGIEFRRGRSRPTPWKRDRPEVKELLPFTGAYARFLQALFPIAKGTTTQLVGRTASGKTTLFRRLLQGLDLTKVRVVLLQIGERAHEVRNHLPEQVELFAATVRQSLEESLYVADAAYARAESLACSGHDVVLLLDSIYRLASIDTVAEDEHRQASAGTAGVSNRALYAFRKKRLAIAGDSTIPGRGSVTLIATQLDEPGNRLAEALLPIVEGSVDITLHTVKGLSVPIIPIDMPASYSRVGTPALADGQLAASQRLRDLLQQRLEAYLAMLILPDVKARSWIDKDKRERYLQMANNALQEDLGRIIKTIEAHKLDLPGIWKHVPIMIANNPPRYISPRQAKQLPTHASERRAKTGPVLPAPAATSVATTNGHPAQPVPAEKQNGHADQSNAAVIDAIVGPGESRLIEALARAALEGDEAWLAAANRLREEEEAAKARLSAAEAALAPPQEDAETLMRRLLKEAAEPPTSDEGVEIPQ